MQLGGIPGDHDALGILPGSLADAVARIDGGLAVGALRRQIGPPGFCSGARGLRQGLAIIVGAGQTAEIGAVADADRGHEEAGIGRLGLRGLRRDRNDSGNAKTPASDYPSESGH
jgi:hypothetical protein